MFGTSVALSIFYYCVPRLIRHMKTESKPSLLEQLKEACRDGDVDKYFTLKERDNSLLSAYVDKNGWSLLHHAAYGGSEIIFKDLLEQKDFDIHKKTKSSKTVLHIAAKEGRKEICRLIIDNTEYENLLDMKNDKDMNAGHIAARYGQTDIIEMLMKTRCDLLEKVGPLLENIAIFACKGRSLETMTFIGSHQNLKVALHEKNYQGWNVAHYAAKSGNCEILEYLIAEEGVDCINESTDEKKNCLHTACENGHYEACKCLIKNNSGLLHLRDINRNHAGHYAAKNGNITIIKYLKDQGLDLELTNKENVNILHISCLHAHLELFKYLAKEFPRLLNQKSNKSKNAVLFVMQRKDDEDKRIKILSYLVNRGLDVYHVPASGKSALYLACKNRAYSLCEHLLKNYPKFYDIDEGDLTAIEAADNDSRIKVLFSKYDPKHKTSSRYVEKICIIL
ncbi:putative ankyrin repeat protein RF_0381 [Saccostrea cucullata]|uniref:putative ankyrin repeat protein RF_0381 n=1 Tax=Saccostrea cuccullata TaxID=36930 RepID=UPI002ED0FDE6